MKIVHLSTFSVGGAAIAASRLHEQLLDKGIDSTLIFLYKNDSPVKKTLDFRDHLSFSGKIDTKIRNKFLALSEAAEVKKFGKPPEYFSFPQTVWKIEEHPEIRSADIIHMHWVAGFFDYTSLLHPDIKNKKIVWTLHDMNPFSGGFHYEDWFDASPWTTLSEVNLQFKKQICKQINITPVAPSQWIKEQSEKSLVFEGKQHVHIPNPSSKTFCLKNKSEARKKLGLNDSTKVTLIPGDDPDYLRKGIKELEHQLQKQNHGVTFLTTGKRKLKLGTHKQIHIGKITTEREMALCYDAADLMIFPSLEENFSNTLVEALLCGCPVLAFDTGGNREIICDPLFGKLVPLNDWQNFLFSLKDQTSDKAQIALRAAEQFTSENAVNSYLGLYNKIML